MLEVPALTYSLKNKKKFKAKEAQGNKNTLINVKDVEHVEIKKRKKSEYKN